MYTLTFCSNKTEVRPSAIHGWGMFARAPIARGEMVAAKGGAVLHLDEWATIEPEVGSAEIQISDNFVVGPRNHAERQSTMLFLNHSCSPNLGVLGQISFVAMRDILQGEELTYDWAMTDNLDYSMACTCRSVECRGQVSGKDWMRPELQERYADYFSAYLLAKIKQMPNRRRILRLR